MTINALGPELPLPALRAEHSRSGAVPQRPQDGVLLKMRLRIRVFPDAAAAGVCAGLRPQRVESRKTPSGQPEHRCLLRRLESSFLADKEGEPPLSATP